MNFLPKSWLGFIQDYRSTWVFDLVKSGLILFLKKHGWVQALGRQSLKSWVNPSIDPSFITRFII
jgi:hypothetical protein